MANIDPEIEALLEKFQKLYFSEVVNKHPNKERLDKVAEQLRNRGVTVNVQVAYSGVERMVERVFVVNDKGETSVLTKQEIAYFRSVTRDLN